jgi:hypothetical protein
MPELNRDELIKECGKSIACIHAVDYYIKYMQNPCYPPDYSLTTKARKYFMELLEKYGRPRCDIERLVKETLKQTELEGVADEAAAAAVLIKKCMNVTSRVAAALAVLITARRRGLYVSRSRVAALFKTSVASINEMKEREALKIIWKLRQH